MTADCGVIQVLISFNKVLVFGAFVLKMLQNFADFPLTYSMFLLAEFFFVTEGYEDLFFLSNSDSIENIIHCLCCWIVAIVLFLYLEIKNFTWIRIIYRTH